jgi:transposase
MEISILRRQGKSLREIAVATLASVNTVRKYLAIGAPPRYKTRPAKPGKLDPFKDYLVKRVEAARPDWVPATVLAREIRGQGFSGCERRSAFVATLGRSRASYIEYVTDERIETLVACHVHAFEFFGGVAQGVLYDNVKTVVRERDGYGPGVHRFHPTMRDVAKHYNFQPRLCRPYRARTKA